MLLMFWMMMMMIGAMMIRGCFWQGGDVLTQRACNPVRESLTNSLSITVGARRTIITMRRRRRRSRRRRISMMRMIRIKLMTMAMRR